MSRASCPSGASMMDTFQPGRTRRQRVRRLSSGRVAVRADYKRAGRAG
ncbi:hypothetical protein [Castellaniella sp.]|nr:hypothetical protein [Castellaniella sp.]